MTYYYEHVTAIPWADVLPLPYAPVAFVLSLGLSFWYGYRHPREY